ncbi:unnamed protein product [Ascophyllum nodosum]
MALPMFRTMLLEIVHVVNPRRYAVMGSNLLAGPYGLELAGIKLDGAPAPASSTFDDIFGALWLAVPKKRVPRGKKRTRTDDRTPKRTTNYSLCNKCGGPKLNHKFCDNIELCAREENASVVQAER